MLTDDEIDAAYIAAGNQELRPQDKHIAYGFARAIIAAHTAKLVDMEPVELSSPQDERAVYGYTATQMAAARTQQEQK